ncbi:hypothetical protein Tco_0909012 [Tanacetum coccineum]|uniref:DUF2382 domain-containing protein n=1 Tax=Tanacetum coccineum TaxID=301880 RepID=A0ABQ5CQL5_9ASTR
MEVVKQIDLNKQVVESDNELESDTEDVLPEVVDPDAVIEEVTLLVITEESHEIPLESHEIPEESLEIQVESHEIQVESHEIKVESQEIQRDSRRIT